MMPKFLLFRVWLIILSVFWMTADAETCMPLWEPICYDENAKLQQTIAENFLKILHQKFELPATKARILDIGAGTGRLSDTILEHFPGTSLIGIDASKEMVEFANHNF